MPAVFVWPEASLRCSNSAVVEPIATVAVNPLHYTIAEEDCGLESPHPGIPVQAFPLLLIWNIKDQGSRAPPLPFVVEVAPCCLFLML